MSTLADRIRGDRQTAGCDAGHLPLPDASTCQHRATERDLTDRLRRDRRSLERRLGGDWRDGCFVVERRRRAVGAPRHASRSATLRSGWSEASDDAALFTSGAPARPPFVFFDLETTGLSGGAGTLAFLVGCGWFDDDGAFVTRQFLLTRVRGRAAAARSASPRSSARAGALVSFNGKSFDAPLLETRYLFHRLEWTGGAAAARRRAASGAAVLEARRAALTAALRERAESR